MAFSLDRMGHDSPVNITIGRTSVKQINNTPDLLDKLAGKFLLETIWKLLPIFIWP
ncbi:MAG TPA: hypothetical protein V6D11_10035 [Waterburya sp.]